MGHYRGCRGLGRPCAGGRPIAGVRASAACASTVTLVAPLEVRNEQELAEVAHLARKLVLR